MSICSKCSLDLPSDMFFVRDASTGKRHSQCKSCYKAVRVHSHAAHYAQHKEEYKDRAKKRRLRIRKENRQKMMLYLSTHPCEQCEESDPVVLDFDHRDRGEKVNTINEMMRLGRSWDKILKEIVKCRVLCSNCHRRRTAKQCGSYRLGDGSEGIMWA